VITIGVARNPREVKVNEVSTSPSPPPGVHAGIHGNKGTYSTSGPKKPLVLFDGECGFCRSGMERWKQAGEGKLDFAPSQSGQGEAYGFPATQPLGALKLVERDGQIQSGAAAVFRMMDLCENRAGSTAWAIYKKLVFFRALADWGYARVAARRAVLSSFSCKIPSPQGR